MKRISSISFLALTFSWLLFSACRKKPDYSDTPYITINPIRHYVVFSGNTQTMVDSLVLSLNFQDGDGDLGLDQNDLLVPPWHGNFNILVDVYRKTGNTYTLLNLSPPYSGNFPVLAPKKISGPINGTMEYGIAIAQPFQPVNDVLRFEIRILDRALNISNTVTTPDITINTP
jgi:hypothetical protein